MAGAAGEQTVREISAEDAAVLMAYGKKVIIVPGYGMAVAQAQRTVRELMDLLIAKGVDVEFAIPQDRVPDIQSRLGEGAQLPVGAWDRARTRRLDAGMFSTLDNQVDTTTGTVKAKARFANADGALFPNQFVNVRLLLRTISGLMHPPAPTQEAAPQLAV